MNLNGELLHEPMIQILLKNSTKQHQKPNLINIQIF
jgi:hypothetical protein